MRLSRFNEAGIRRLAEVLEEARQDSVIQTPLDITSNGDFVELISGGREFDVLRFRTRADLAKYVDDLLSASQIDDDMNDTGLWAWLAAVLLDSTCPADDKGKRTPGKDYRHIPSNDWRDFYRHLIRGPVRILRLFKDNREAANIVLCQSPHAPGDFVEQLASRQERITNTAIIEAANRLYFDTEKRRPKVGASPNWRKPGTLRRFGDILDQLDLTYDLYSMSASDLMTLLPLEFSEYANR